MNDFALVLHLVLSFLVLSRNPKIFFDLVQPLLVVHEGFKMAR